MPTPPSPAPRFSLTGPWLAVLGVVLAALLAWSRLAADPDFFLPDPFAPLMAWVAAVFLATGFVRSVAVRANARLALAVLPVLLVLGLEVHAWRRDAGLVAQRIELVEDPLLRFRYRPGARPDGQEPPVSSVGLRDVEHAVEKPAGVFRIVVLGDSVPNDPRIPFRDRFHQVLQRRLQAAAPPGTTVEVLNVSCEGWATYQEVRALELVGLRFRPDLVVVAHVLNDAFVQNGGYRRVGDSFFLFTLWPLLDRALGRSECAVFRDLRAAWSSHLVETAPLGHLRTLAALHGFAVVVASLPLVTRFDDPVCDGLYRGTGALAAALGFGHVPLVDAFRGEDHRRFLKEGQAFDTTHPNAEGHARIGEALARALAPRLPGAAPSR